MKPVTFHSGIRWGYPSYLLEFGDVTMLVNGKLRSGSYTTLLVP